MSTSGPKLPGEVTKGGRPSASAQNMLKDAAKQAFPRFGGVGARLSRGPHGFTFQAPVGAGAPTVLKQTAVGALQLTKRANIFWEDPGIDPAPFRAWVNMGTLDNFYPSNIVDPFEIAPDVTQITYRRIWLHCEWAGVLIGAVPSWTLVALAASAPSTAGIPVVPASAPVNTEASPGISGIGNQDYFNIGLGTMQVLVTGTAPNYVRRFTVFSDDTGSMRSRASVVQNNYTAPMTLEEPATISALRNVIFYRNAAP